MVSIEENYNGSNSESPRSYTQELVYNYVLAKPDSTFIKIMNDLNLTAVGLNDILKELTKREDIKAYEQNGTWVFRAELVFAERPDPKPPAPKVSDLVDWDDEPTEMADWDLDGLVDDDPIEEITFKDIDEIFLITHSGLLLSHQSTKESSDIDKDILASMLTVVQSFVTDSMGSSNAIEKLNLGEYCLNISQGRFITCVAISSKDLSPLNKDIAKMIDDIETENHTVLEDFSGDQDEVSQIDKAIKQIIGVE